LPSTSFWRPAERLPSRRLTFPWPMSACPDVSSKPVHLTDLVELYLLLFVASLLIRVTLLSIRLLSFYVLEIYCRYCRLWIYRQYCWYCRSSLHNWRLQRHYSPYQVYSQQNRSSWMGWCRYVQNLLAPPWPSNLNSFTLVVPEEDTVLKIYDSLFESNYGGFGGAIDDGGKANTHVKNCTFLHGTSLYGGAAYVLFQWKMSAWWLTALLLLQLSLW